MTYHLDCTSKFGVHISNGIWIALQSFSFHVHGCYDICSEHLTRLYTTVDRLFKHMVSVSFGFCLIDRWLQPAVLL